MGWCSLILVWVVLMHHGTLKPTPLDELTVNLNLNDVPNGGPTVESPGIESEEWKTGKTSTKESSCNEKRNQRQEKEMDGKRKRLLGGERYHPFGVSDQPDWENWTASLKLGKKGKGLFQCGGVLVSNQLVLTALHCLVDPDGTGHLFPKDQVEIYFDRRELHYWKGIMFKPIAYFYLNEKKGKPELLPGTVSVKDDIAGIKLDRPITGLDCLAPIDLSTRPGYWYLNGDYCVSGWGTYRINPERSPKFLQYTDKLQSIPCPLSHDIEPMNMCFQNTDVVAICAGDSGNPGVVSIKGKLGPKWHIQGIISRAHSDPFSNKTKCGAEDMSVDMDVYQYRDQIETWKKQ